MDSANIASLLITFKVVIVTKLPSSNDACIVAFKTLKCSDGTL